MIVALVVAQSILGALAGALARRPPRHAVALASLITLALLLANYAAFLFGAEWPAGAVTGGIAGVSTYMLVPSPAVARART